MAIDRSWATHSPARQQKPGRRFKRPPRETRAQARRKKRTNLYYHIVNVMFERIPENTKSAILREAKRRQQLEALAQAQKAAAAEQRKAEKKAKG